MPPSASLDAHKPYLDIWAQALSAPRGIRIKTPNPTDLRGRLYHARAAERRNNTKIFPADNPMHGKSYYDNFIIKATPGAIEIVPVDTIAIEGVEEL